MLDSTITYFGFGSLVNRATRPAGEVSVPATLMGWSRHWAHHAVGIDGNRISRCSLTVKRGAQGLPSPAGTVAIDGVLVTIPTTELPNLDKRERGYDRVEVPTEQFHLTNENIDTLGTLPAEISVYVSKPELTAPADVEHPILQSYIDCVMGGFDALFGAAGLQRFIETTVGWHGPIENDRLQPRYPRAIALSDAQLARYDSLLRDHRP